MEGIGNHMFDTSERTPWKEEWDTLGSAGVVVDGRTVSKETGEVKSKE